MDAIRPSKWLKNAILMTIDAYARVPLHFGRYSGAPGCLICTQFDPIIETGEIRLKS